MLREGARELDRVCVLQAALNRLLELFIEGALAGERTACANWVAHEGPTQPAWTVLVLALIVSFAFTIALRSGRATDTQLG